MTVEEERDDRRDFIDRTIKHYQSVGMSTGFAVIFAHRDANIMYGDPNEAHPFEGLQTLVYRKPD